MPFLDYRLVEFVFRRGFPFRIHDGWTKWLLRQAVCHVLPPAVTWRRDKVGYETPETEWIRKWLDSNPAFFHAGALIAQYVDIGALNGAVSEWMKHGGDTTDVRRVWRWINLEVWLELWHDGGNLADR